ncbi:hypothetical protein BSNK01_12020 [Bacillaceae bacterium]
MYNLILFIILFAIYYAIFLGLVAFPQVTSIILSLFFATITWHGIEIRIGDVFKFVIFPLKRFLD